MQGDWVHTFVALSKLLSLDLVTAIVAWVMLHATVGRSTVRVVSLLALCVVNAVALAYWMPRADVLAIDLMFFWLHFGFLFRYLSSIWYFRDGTRCPTLFFHVVMLLLAARQHYGAGNWEQLKGRRLSFSLLKEWGGHLLHMLIVSSLAVLAIVIAYQWPLPFYAPAWFRNAIVMGSFGILGLMGLTLIADIQSMLWSLGGYHTSFFGRYPFLKSNHPGEFWATWNTFAVRAFRELTSALRLRRHRFLNIMAIFLVSGLLHQLTLAYFLPRDGVMLERLPYGMTLAFVLNGLAVWFFGWLHQRRRRMPKVVQILIFNPVTTLLVLIPISLPMSLDFYGMMAV